MPSQKRRSPWLILGIVLLASVAASLNQFKVPPLMPILMESFHLSSGRAGLLMSVFAITGLLLAIPAGFIFQKLGYRAMGLLALGCIVLGASGGAMSGKEAFMLASRFVEGAGMSLIAVVSPAIVAIWFKPDQRGKAMGILATWVPLGSTGMFLLAPWLAHRWNWQGVWWFGSLYALFVGILFHLFVQPGAEPSSKPDRAGSPERLTGTDMKQVLRSRDLWLIGLLFACFNSAFVSYATWAPAFLHEIRGRTLADASYLVSTVTLLAIFSCPLAGWVSDRLRSRKLILVVPMALMAVLLPLLYALRSGVLLPYLTSIGFIVGFPPTGVFSSASEIVRDERLGGMAMAIVLIGQNVGMLLGPFIFGYMIEFPGGWQIAFWSLAPVCALGAVTGGLARVR
jgi:MFS family permease